MMRWLLIVALAVMAGVVRAAEPVSFARYQVIIDRSPFGAPAGTGAAAPMPNFAEQFTFVGLVPDPVSKKVLAIVQDRERAYLKAQGESIGDVEVRQIEMAGGASKIVLGRGLEVATLRFKDRAGGAVPILPAGSTSAGPILQPGQQKVQGGQPGEVPARRRIPFRRGDE